MSSCPPVPTLHALVDGDLDRAATASIETHLRACGRCRDAVRALRRLDHYLSRAWTAPPAAAEVATVLEGARLASAGGRAQPVSVSEEPEGVAAAVSLAFGARSGGWKRGILGLAAAVLVAVVLVLPIESWLGRSPVAASPGQGLTARLRAADPELDPDVPGEKLLACLGSEDRGEEAGQAALGLPVAQRLREGLGDSPSIRDLLRYARLASLAGVGDLRLRLEAGLRTPGLSRREIVHGLYSLAIPGGSGAVRSILRVSTGLELPPQELAEALIRTGAASAAPNVWRLLRESEVDADTAYVTLGRLPGSGVDRILTDDFLAGADSPVLVRLLAERPGALALLRAALSRAGPEERIRILRLLGQAGDREAVPLLERALVRGGTFVSVVRALEGIARTGSREALLVLARALPNLEEPEGWPRTEDERELQRVFEALPAAAGEVYAEVLGSSSRGGLRVSDWRRFLLAAGLCRARTALPEMLRSLERSSVRRAALTAMAFLGAAEAIPEVVRQASSEDRGTRHCALGVLAILGGDQAADALERAMARSSDRRVVARLVSARPAAWMRPVLEAGLRYRDSSQSCQEALDRLGGEEATPEGASAEASAGPPGS